MTRSTRVIWSWKSCTEVHAMLAVCSRIWYDVYECVIRSRTNTCCHDYDHVQIESHRSSRGSVVMCATLLRWPSFNARTTLPGPEGPWMKWRKTVLLLTGSHHGRLIRCQGICQSDFAVGRAFGCGAVLVACHSHDFRLVLSPSRSPTELWPYGSWRGCLKRRRSGSE